MRKLTALLFLAVTGCGASGPQVDQCEQWAIAKLRSPQSYDAQQRRQKDLTVSGREIRMVRIYFTATSKSGQSQLNQAMCSFPMRNGQVGPQSFSDSFIVPDATSPQSVLK